MVIQNIKKRKYETFQNHSELDHFNSPNNYEKDDLMIDPIDSILFEEMAQVNGQLISLVNKVKLVDNRYFVHNSGMLDEFIGNIHEFLKQVDVHRKKVLSEKLNSDTLFSVYQFLDAPTLVHHCRLVSKTWRDTLNRMDFKVTLGLKKIQYIDNLLNSSLIKRVTSLKLIGAIAYTYQSLSKCDNLDSLTVLDLSENNLGKTCVSFLKKCSTPNLRELYLANVHKFKDKEARELFDSSSIMSSVRVLDLSDSSLSGEFFESVSNKMNQLTHLRVSKCQISVFLKDKVNLQHLNLKYYILCPLPQFFTNNSSANISFLDITSCSVDAQELSNLIVSPNLPNLVTLRAQNLTWTNSYNTVVELAANSQSSLTELDLSYSSIKPFPTLIYHCPRLKRLSLKPDSIDEESQKIMIKFLQSPSLSNLEYLDIYIWKEVYHILFTHSRACNLKELHLTPLKGITIDSWDGNLIHSCKHFMNLTRLSFKLLPNSFLQYFRNNPTFTKLKSINNIQIR